MSIGWKVLFACCPPPHWGGGLPCFIISISFLSVLTAIVREVANIMSCEMGLKPGITAITFIAIGFSFSDALASMTAARDSPYADSAVGNITGYNTVNVLLGLGIPWVIAAVHKRNNNEVYKMPSKGLDLSVIVFVGVSLVGLAINIFRRCYVKGELGGSTFGRALSAFLLTLLWIIYLVISILGLLGVITISSETS